MGFHKETKFGFAWNRFEGNESQSSTPKSPSPGSNPGLVVESSQILATRPTRTVHTVILKLVALVGRLLLSVGIHFKLVTDPARLHFFFTSTESNPGLEGEVRKS